MNTRENYLNYLENVVGIKSVLLGSDESRVEVPLLVAVEGLKQLSQSENELLLKMVGALKMDPSQIKTVDLAEAVNFSPKFKVFLSSNPSLHNKDSICVSTYSPQLLNSRPDLKKTAWVELQKVMQFFGTN